MKYILKDGVLYDPDGNAPFPDADYFTTVEEAERWFVENKIQGEVVEYEE